MGYLTDKIGGVTGAENNRWSEQGNPNKQSYQSSHRWWSYNLETKVRLQDGYKQRFETKMWLPSPGTGSRETFVVKVTGGA